MPCSGASASENDECVPNQTFHVKQGESAIAQLILSQWVGAADSRGMCVKQPESRR